MPVKQRGPVRDLHDLIGLKPMPGYCGRLVRMKRTPLPEIMEPEYRVLRITALAVLRTRPAVTFHRPNPCVPG